MHVAAQAIFLALRLFVLPFQESVQSLSAALVAALFSHSTYDLALFHARIGGVLGVLRAGSRLACRTDRKGPKPFANNTRESYAAYVFAMPWVLDVWNCDGCYQGLLLRGIAFSFANRPTVQLQVYVLTLLLQGPERGSLRSENMRTNV